MNDAEDNELLRNANLELGRQLSRAANLLARNLSHTIGRLDVADAVAELLAANEQLRNERDLFIAMVADVRNAERSRSMGVRGVGDKANWFDAQAVHDALSGIGPFSMKLAAEAGEDE